MSRHNLQKLTNQELELDLTRLVREERRITTEILWHLKEVEQRRLFAALGYSSLFDYCTRALKYSEPAAQRRIEAMRLIKAIPELGARIEDGSLSVTAVCLASRTFRELEKTGVAPALASASAAQAKKVSLEEKRQVLEQLIGKSKKECEAILVDLAPVAFTPKDSQRIVSSTKTEVKFIADQSLIEKLDRVKQLIAHSLPSPTTAELLNYMADLVLKKIDPTTPKKRSAKNKNAVEAQAQAPVQTNVQARAVSNSRASASSTLAEVTPNPPIISKPHSRYIPQPLKRYIWQRDKAQCTYKTKHGIQCKSRYALEIDHITPHALGGRTSPQNLRLLCRTHNQFRARQTFA